MPPKVKPLCKAKVKTEGLKVQDCNQPLYNGRCEQKNEHMLPYPTGFCQNGDHEGTARKSYTGKPRKTCDWWKRCPCNCHVSYDQMFIASEMPRTVVDNSGYSPERGEFKMPTLEERVALMAASITTDARSPRYVESAVPDRVPAHIERPYVPTTTGRSARGELESYVKEVCDVWVVESKYENIFCTPTYIAEEIAKTKGIKAPSTGAIDAVLKRWAERFGFCTLELKPTRFTGYTEEGVKLGLDEIKAKVKRREKMKKAAKDRGVRL